WSLSNNGISGYLNTLAISGNNIFAGTDNGVYISTDNGLDWFQAGMNGTSVYSLLAGVDTIFAGTQYGVYLSTDNGTTWSLLSNGIPGNIPFWASAINGNNIFVGGADPNYLYEEVFCSTDKGFSWTKVNVGIPQNNIVTSLAFSGENILAGTDGAGVYLSSDKGSTWSIVNDGLTSPYVHAIAVIGNNIFAGTDTYGGVGGVYVSTNGGSNWTQINDGFTNLEVASLAVSNSNVYAGTGGSGVWKRSVLDLLPLELKVFNATVRQDAVQLVWNTSTEINNYGFEIQRTLHSQSPTDLNWEILGFIKGSGNSNSVKQYSFLDKSILKNGSYYYRLKQVDFDGQYKYYNSAVVDVSFINQSYSLENNYPNPFNPVTVIKYSLSFDSKVKLTIYNALGQTVRELISEIQQSGIHEIKFDGLNLPSGVFYYSILAASLDGKQVYTNSKKMILLK
ncbi:MAG: T9SS type A sorting domain-containing protein, partial [Ignavibacteriaceae bacterium]|nr:T9SS type A sorting domain-containing protein [Ignavibacteriaceae bacterium]